MATNKERIISNNTRLQNISTELDSLPEYEDINSETSQQIDIITGLAVVTSTEITSSTGTNKEKLQINNTNLQSIKTNLTYPVKSSASSS